MTFETFLPGLFNLASINYSGTGRLYRNLCLFADYCQTGLRGNAHYV